MGIVHLFIFYSMSIWEDKPCNKQILMWGLLCNKERSYNFAV